ncbi:hypothetical protein [Legionella septentrionalis]|uniref:hypothetical protein n=1 Tax=Legionella septentrionalis TaxID=2498109 RepID=UPI000F8D8ABF|nr:hypothetical protein [Legionella septentrionalis]RUR16118.1 hypothetical protein ELY10_04250 [Legionella septentrionalis]
MFGPMFHSVVLAQVLGLYFTVIAIILLSRKTYFQALVLEMRPDGAQMIVAAAFGFLLGLFIVVTHNIWVLEPRVLVTIIGWIILIKSLLWLALPERMVSVSKNMYSGPTYYVIAAIVLIVGLILLIKGFYFYVDPDYYIGPEDFKG